ncbi:mannosyl-3-phosphoglycerate phosphatase [Thermoflexibacter ruber]|uniref:Mannosyl-3-phosphoglycerate phosphatase n=1 Tax=Thermoflexibacter ruber TaxID=1003 RepID=A0A1I2HXJ1_9BACT|nr:mannosyl-3-phosphoglycerate phosphatase [Thermoflexibacter ruber]SFF34070.1 glucosyl-3-phosphoglycerate phosphatase [Thermoflexibacter ruber]
MNQYVVYTDLDGTLLDINTYSFDLAKEAVGELNAHQIPLVFCSTKTFAEQIYYQHELGVTAPFIVENGSAIFIPQNYFSFPYHFDSQVESYQVIELGKPVSLIRKAMRDINRNLGMRLRGFNDMPMDELERLLGLDKDKIHKALAKSYTKTLLNSLSEKEVLKIKEELLKSGLTIAKGSKFYSVMSIDTDKGKAVKILNELFAKKYKQFTSVGIGDGLNDFPMLKVVDRPFLVQRHKGFWENLNHGNIEKIEAVSSQGFSKVIQLLLAQ